MLLAAVIAGGEFAFKAANSLFFGKRRASLAVFVKSVCIRFQVFLVGPSFHLRRIGSYMSGSRGVATCSCLPSGNAVVGRYKGRGVQGSGAKFSQ